MNTDEVRSDFKSLIPKKKLLLYASYEKKPIRYPRSLYRRPLLGSNKYIIYHKREDSHGFAKPQGPKLTK